MSDIIFWLIVGSMLIAAAALFFNVALQSRRDGERKRLIESMFSRRLHHGDQAFTEEPIDVGPAEIVCIRPNGNRDRKSAPPLPELPPGSVIKRLA